MEREIKTYLLVAIALSICAVVMSAVSLHNNSEEVVYQRILEECYAEFKPMYDDFGWNAEKPKTFRDLMRPLVTIVPAIADSAESASE